MPVAYTHLDVYKRQGNDMAGLRRIIQNHKVDGVVLLRTMVDDPPVTFLQERRIPFVTVGSCNYKDVKQIDHDHKSACRALTSIMLMRGMKKMCIRDRQICR